MFGRARRSRPFRGFLLIAAAVFFAFLRPLWVRGGGPPASGETRSPARWGGRPHHFGFFFFLCLIWWAASARRAWPARLAQTGLGTIRRRRLPAAALVLAVGFFSADALCVAGILLFLPAALYMTEEPEDRLAFGFLATAFFLVLLTQRMFIYDRMNTFFKLYSEAWPLSPWDRRPVSAHPGAPERSGTGRESSGERSSSFSPAVSSLRSQPYGEASSDGAIPPVATDP
jgi:hypothetical protein